jgi:zinc transporter ZupT
VTASARCLGFVVGPAAVGVIADLATLPVALATVAGVALLLAALTAFAPGAPREAAPQG